MEFVANCMDCARHRRRKAAAKKHLRLDPHSFLPSFATVDSTGQHDIKRATSAIYQSIWKKSQSPSHEIHPQAL